MKVAIQLPLEGSWGLQPLAFDAQFRHGQATPGQWAILESLQPLPDFNPTGLPILHKGYIDAHVHMNQLGERAQSLDFGSLKNREDLRAFWQKPSVKSAEKITKGYGWVESQWGLTLEQWVEEFTPLLPEDFPVIYFRVCQHSAFVNRRTQKMLGLNFKSTFLTDRELFQVYEKLPPASQSNCEKYFLAAQAQMLAQGISAVGDMCLDETTFAAVKNLAEMGQLALDVQGVYLAGAAPSLDKLGPQSIRNARVLGPMDRPAELTVRHWKKFLDGSFGARTAWLSQAYADAETFGERLVETSSLIEEAREALYSGFHLSFHAIGDAALDQALKVGEKLQKIMEMRGEGSAGSGLPTRHRLEHVQLVRDDQVKKMAEQNFWTAVLQPGHRAADEKFVRQRLGNERYKSLAYPLARFLRAGVPVALSSDAPVDRFDPASVIKMSGAENSAAEKITTAEAIWYFGTGARRALGIHPGRIGAGSTVFLANAAQ